MSAEKDRKLGRLKRHIRLRQRVRGTSQRPRLCVTKTLNHMYAQVIDDELGHTLVAACSREAGIADENGRTGNVQAAGKVGEAIGRRAVEKGISEVVFDRSGWPYHGRVKAVAEAAREAGLKF